MGVAMELAGGMLFAVLLVALVGVLVSAVLVHVTAKLCGVEGATFGKAVKAVLANMAVSFLLSLVFSIVPLAGTFLGMILSLVATLWVLKKIYDVSWGKALLLWLLQWVVLVVLGIAAAMLLGMSAAAL